MRITTTGALATVAVTALLVTNPLSAQAAKLITGAQIKNGTITSVDVKDRSLLAKDFKTGQLPQGPAGPAGPSGVVDVQGFGGEIATVAATGNDVLQNVTPVFTGIPAEVTLTETSTLLVSGTQVLGTTGAPGSIAFAVCFAADGEPLTVSNVFGAYLVAPAGSTRTAFASSGTRVLPSGVYQVGTCADPGAVTLDSNDYSNGTVQVVAGGNLPGMKSTPDHRR